MQYPTILLRTFCAFFVALLLLGKTCIAQFPYSQFGVSLCGPEFGQDQIPGILNKDYVYPRTDEVNYFANKGVSIVQLPFRWERLQKQLGAELDMEEVNRMKTLIYDCEFRGLMVILNMHNFGRYKSRGEELVLGSAQLPIKFLRDFWKKMAIAFKANKNIYAFDIMNEPHDLGENVWFNAAQQTIWGIREINTNLTVMVEGDHYANANVWEKFSDNLKYLKDPSNKIVFNAHCYFDHDVSGRYTKSYEHEGAHEQIGVQRVKPFIDWIKKNGVKGYVGEFGVPRNDARWLPILENFLEYLTANHISGSYWAAGPWWKNYPLSLEPVNGQDQPQMAVYTKYINSSSNVAKNNTFKNTPPQAIQLNSYSAR